MNSLLINRRSRLGLNHLASFDLNDENIRSALSALGARRTDLVEFDIAVDTLHFNLPERGADGSRFCFTSLLDRCDCGQDAVIAAIPVGEASRIVTLLLPFRDE